MTNGFSPRILALIAFFFKSTPTKNSRENVYDLFFSFYFGHLESIEEKKEKISYFARRHRVPQRNVSC